MNGFEKGDRVELIETTKYLPPVGSRGVLVHEPTDGSGFFLHDPMADVCFDDGETHPVYLRRLKKIDNQLTPKPGTKFRVKAGCSAAYRAGDRTAALINESIPVLWTLRRVLPPGSKYAGQWELDGPPGKGWLVVDPKWLEPVEEPKIDVPSPPVAGKGVHAQPPHVAEAGKETIKQGDHTMANPIKIETQLLIDGSPLKEFSDDSLFSIISEQEAAIKKYEAIENRPKALEAKIAAIQAGIAALVEAIDTRGPGDKPEA